jgi:hypothetical protein
MTDGAKDLRISNELEAEAGRKAWVAPSVMRLQAGAAELAIGDINDGIGDES